MAHSKANLPTKICLTCGRPFTWRKKWERDWDQIRYCSEACRRSKSKPGAMIRTNRDDPAR